MPGPMPAASTTSSRPGRSYRPAAHSLVSEYSVSPSLMSLPGTAGSATRAGAVAVIGSSPCATRDRRLLAWLVTYFVGAICM